MSDLRKDLRQQLAYIERRIILSFLLASTSSVIASSAHTADKNEPTDMEQRGKLLRAEIDRTYQELEKKHLLRAENDISNVVLKYVPIGMNFDDAEAILRYAGFNIGPRQDANQKGNLPGGNAVRAIISPYIKIFPSRTEVSVLIWPEGPGLYQKGISRIAAAIIIIYP